MSMSHPGHDSRRESAENGCVHSFLHQERLLSEVYLSESQYDCLVDVLLNKKNIILQGAPGVGKTFCANRLAYSLMGEKTTVKLNSFNSIRIIPTKIS